MVKHYRWDFIGLSTYSKPTPELSPKVVDGSTYYEADTSKLFVFCKGNWYEKTATGGGGGTVNSVNNVSPDSNGNVNLSPSDIGAQAALTAGSNVTIENGIISATNTTYSNFVGTDGTAAGTAGLVPAPATTDAGKVLSASGSWTTPEGGIKTLTTADYNYPANNPAGVALWLLEPGIYKCDASQVKMVEYATDNAQLKPEYALIIILRNNYSSRKTYIFGGTYLNMRYDTVDANGANVMSGKVLSDSDVENTLNSTSTTNPLSASQGRVLKNKIEGRLTTNAGAPTTSTTGTKGQLLEDTTNGNLYICTNSASPYAWRQIDKDEILTNAGTPTTSTAGTLGQLLTDTTNAKLYQLTAIDNTDPQNIVYTWTEVGAGGGGGGDVFVAKEDGQTFDKTADEIAAAIAAGKPVIFTFTYQNTLMTAVYSGQIWAGYYKCYAYHCDTSSATDTSLYLYEISIKRESVGTTKPAVPTTNIYKLLYTNPIKTDAVAHWNSNYKLVGAAMLANYLGNKSNLTTTTTTNLVAAINEVNGKAASLVTAIINGGTTAPTSATVGAVGTQYTYVDTTGTPTAHLCVCTEIDNTYPSNPVYNWSTII